MTKSAVVSSICGQHSKKEHKPIDLQSATNFLNRTLLPLFLVKPEKLKKKNQARHFYDLLLITNQNPLNTPFTHLTNNNCQHFLNFPLFNIKNKPNVT